MSKSVMVVKEGQTRVEKRFAGKRSH